MKHFQYTKSKIRLNEPVETESSGLIGVKPFGIPVNVVIEQAPACLLNVKAQDHSVRIGSFPWKYLIEDRNYYKVKICLFYWGKNQSAPEFLWQIFDLQTNPPRLLDTIQRFNYEYESDDIFFLDNYDMLFYSNSYQAKYTILPIQTILAAQN